jgi:hypothetical protein
MTGQISSQEARRRVVQLGTFEDGLWDMLLGGVFILLGLYPVTRNLLGPVLNLFFFFGVLALLIAAVSYARRIFSVPRVGMVKLNRGPLATIARITLFVVTLSLVVATLFMTHAVEQPALAGAATWLSRLGGDILFAALIIGFFTLFAHFTGVPRLHLYGWLIGLGSLASAALMVYAGSTFNWPLALAGLIIVLMGANLFRRFMRRYPVPMQDN